MLGRSGIRAKGAATGVGPPVRRETGRRPRADRDSSAGRRRGRLRFNARRVQNFYRSDGSMPDSNRVL